MNKNHRTYACVAHAALNLAKKTLMRGYISAPVITDSDREEDEDLLKEIKVMDGMLSGYFTKM